MKRMNLTVLVLVAAMAGSTVAGTWHFKRLSQLGYPAASSSATLSWEDPSNWEEGTVPVDDAENTDIVIQMDQGDGTAQGTSQLKLEIHHQVACRSLVVEEVWNNQTQHCQFKGVASADYGNVKPRLTIGAGGFAMSLYPANKTNWGGFPWFAIDVGLAASQTWNMHAHSDGVGKRALFITGDLFAEADVVWTIAGQQALRYVSGSTAGFKGRIVTNTQLQLQADVDHVKPFGDGAVSFVSATIDGLAKNSYGPGMSIFEDAGSTAPRARTITQDIDFSSTGDNSITFSTATRYCTWEQTTTLAGTWTGTVSRGVRFGSWMANVADSSYPFGAYVGAFRPEASRIVLDVDASAMSNPSGGITQTDPRIQIQYGTVVLASQNALGPNNAFSVGLGYNVSRQVPGSVAGLLLKDGITMNGKIVVNAPGYTEQSLGAASHNPSMILILGLDEPGEATFTASGIDNIVIAGKFPKEHQIRMATPAGGLLHFTGSILQDWNQTDDTLSVPIEVLGQGTVEVTHNNYRLPNGFSVRCGTLVLSHTGAPGTGRIDVGGIVPARFDDVQHYMETLMQLRSNSSKFSWADGVYTFQSGYIPSIDGVKPKDGDRVLVNEPANDQQNRNGIYVVSNNGLTWTRAPELDESSEVRHGIRVKVAGGKYAGRTFYLYPREDFDDGVHSFPFPFTMNHANHLLSFSPEPEDQPSVACLVGANGVTVTNAVRVTDNLSTGTSTLGAWTAVDGSCTFASDVSLARDVTLAAQNAAGTVNFTGTFSGTGEIVCGGAGTVFFTGTDSRASRRFAFAGGVFRTDAAHLASAELTWRLSDGATGVLSPTDAVSLDGRTVAIEGAVPEDPENGDAIVLATGVSGVPSVSSALPRGWHLCNVGGNLRLSYSNGLTIIFR